MRKSFELIFLLLFLVLLWLILTVSKKGDSTVYRQNKSLTKKEKQERVVGSDRQLIKILFTGDLMFDRHIRGVAQAKGSDYIFENVEDLLLSNDLVVVNLEGPITNHNSVSVESKIGDKDNYVFTFDPSVAKTLSSHKIHLVNIGNNHILDFGLEGLTQTIQYLKENNIKFFGNVGEDLNLPRHAIVEIQGVKLGFINYNQFVGNSTESTLDDLAKLRQEVDFVFLYTHWGDEYIKYANTEIQKLAREYIDNGVDLIIGSHPHVIQQSEVYKGKTIYYSLGNFVFDQYFSSETKRGLVVEVDINPNTLEVNTKERFVEMDNTGRTELVE